VAKPELGTKRLCSNCGAKFYDLNKDPIVCPKCHTAMALAAVTSTRARPEPVAAPRAVAPAAREEEVVTPETQDAEFVSLEDADAEAQGGKKGAEGEGGEDDIEIDQTLDDAALIEEQEETDEDVTDIIGDREENEEEP
jgi:uncharacterized protein (TIGR02300 family)